MKDTKDTTITIRITEFEKEALKIEAARQDLTLSQLIRKAVREYCTTTPFYREKEREETMQRSTENFKHFADVYNAQYKEK